MKIFFTEQEVVDAVCVHAAAIHAYRPEQIDVDLQFHPKKGFSANARLPYRTVELVEQELIDAITFYLREYHNFIPESLRIDLQFHEQTGFSADINVT
ncbi:hypothetical protein BK708_14350 [Bacillus thuringiensis serovar yunnanensis]|nr:hypothetical protein BK708_14350 [Bacillus thuringiensis serovar yunnanensis]